MANYDKENIKYISLERDVKKPNEMEEDEK